MLHSELLAKPLCQSSNSSVGEVDAYSDQLYHEPYNKELSDEYNVPKKRALK